MCDSVPSVTACSQLGIVKKFYSSSGVEPSFVLKVLFSEIMASETY